MYIYLPVSEGKETAATEQTQSSQQSRHKALNFSALTELTQAFLKFSAICCWLCDN
jgi:hypothetical protein